MLSHLVHTNCWEFLELLRACFPGTENTWSIGARQLRSVIIKGCVRQDRDNKYHHTPGKINERKKALDVTSRVRRRRGGEKKHSN